MWCTFCCFCDNCCTAGLSLPICSFLSSPVVNRRSFWDICRPLGMRMRQYFSIDSRFALDATIVCYCSCRMKLFNVKSQIAFFCTNKTFFILLCTGGELKIIHITSLRMMTNILWTFPTGFSAKTLQKIWLTVLKIQKKTRIVSLPVRPNMLSLFSYKYIKQKAKKSNISFTSSVFNQIKKYKGLVHSVHLKFFTVFSLNKVFLIKTMLW